ncbi:SGNH/GDSL hydrolase family protein [Lacticaseibacillus absianus]|uniref:SGNH/GDSL hydrolase family protein n=1 Tax=Lacticaseibacillus absianus TaxID=2729623 RepID=UPI0015C9FAE2|nr:SGNH/GDSL hydrolase family protein [Lacticaseibacillus absianus]
MQILFNGDSVTDATWRNDPDHHLGYGYPLFVKAMLGERYLDEDVEVINRGVSGDTIGGLEARFTKDCDGLAPDVVSILIGINDTGYNEGKPTFATPEEFDRFEKLYRSILDQARALNIPNIVVMEPFVINDGDVDRFHLRRDLDPKIEIIRRLAIEYHAIYVSLDGMLNQLTMAHGWQRVMRDGVHPGPVGIKLVAEQWCKAVVPRLDQWRRSR